MTKHLIYIAVRGERSPAEAWEDDDCEGWYHCEDHHEKARRSLHEEYDILPISDDALADEVRKEGRCYECWECSVDAERAIYESDAVARWEEYLRR